MNVPYPFFGRAIGFDISAAISIASMIALYFTFRRNDWL
jgi:Mg2+ and Co2+ transporter CorA